MAGIPFEQFLVQTVNGLVSGMILALVASEPWHPPRVIGVLCRLGEAVFGRVVLQCGELLLRIRHMAFEPGDAERGVAENGECDGNQGESDQGSHNNLRHP